MAGADWGIGGRDSRSAAPNDEDGLNGFRALKPVVCCCKGAEEVIEVALVGWLDSGERRGFDVGVDPMVLGEAVLCREVKERPERPFVLLLLWLDGRANSEATFAITDPLAPPVAPVPVNG